MKKFWNLFFIDDPESEYKMGLIDFGKAKTDINQPSTSGIKKMNNKTGKEIIKSMVATADLSRTGFMNGDISTVMSPRTVLTWAENYLMFNDAEYSFKLSFLNRCDELERPIIEEYFQRSFGIDISDAKVANVKE